MLAHNRHFLIYSEVFLVEGLISFYPLKELKITIGNILDIYISIKLILYLLLGLKVKRFSYRLY